MRIKIEVEVNTDPVPGWGYDPQDYVELIRRQLDNTIPHYNPTVRLVEAEQPGEYWMHQTTETPYGDL
jgi:hypothetical protein